MPRQKLVGAFLFSSSNLFYIQIRNPFRVVFKENGGKKFAFFSFKIPLNNIVVRRIMRQILHDKNRRKIDIAVFFKNCIFDIRSRSLLYFFDFHTLVKPVKCIFIKPFCDTCFFICYVNVRIPKSRYRVGIWQKRIVFRTKIVAPKLIVIRKGININNFFLSSINIPGITDSLEMIRFRITQYEAEATIFKITLAGTAGNCGRQGIFTK